MNITQMLILAILAMAPLRQTNANPTEQIDNKQQFKRHVQSLNELTERRRTNRLFYNPQQSSDGKTIGYTNIDKGNTTFAMRDLVLIHQLPIVLTRIYDSSATTSDFGIGWRLSYNEQIIHQHSGEFIYIDDSGSKQTLKQFTQPASDQIQLKDSGFYKIFDLIGNSYKLTQIINSHSQITQSIHIEYQNHLIHRIYNQHGLFITLTRNQQGLIESITDNHNRTVNYHYKNNHLIASQDLAGNWWRYRYQNGQLSRIKDPEARLAAKFTYYFDDTNHGKTKRAKVGMEDNRFYYQQNSTTVVNNRGKHTRYELDGINKVAISTKQPKRINANDQSNITYHHNDKGLLTKIQQKNSQYKATATFDYNDLAQLEKITFPNGNFHQYHYNQLGFRTKTIRNDGSSVEYSYDDTGNLLTIVETNSQGENQLKQMKLDQNNLTTEYIVDGQMMLDIDYDNAGNPRRIAYNGNSVNYFYDDLNRLTTVVDGEQVFKYDYQDDEPDSRIQQDDRSFYSYLDQNHLNHNALTINRLYTRSIASNHAQFKESHTSNIQQDANQRRRLYNALATDQQSQRDFDKPSNSFFIPPTYRAINCEADYCWELIQVDLAGPSNISVGQNATFTATPLLGNMFDEFDNCNVQYQFSVNGDIKAYNTSGIFNYTFGSNGTQQVQIRANCQNCAAFNFQYDSIVVNPHCEPQQTISSLSSDVTVSYQENLILPPQSADITSWGETGFANSTDLLNLDFEAIYNASSNTWRPKINKATSKYWIWWRLLPARAKYNKPEAVKEAKANQANHQNCKKMIADLKTLGSVYVDWYVLAAVEAHEKVHVEEWKTLMNTNFAALKNKLEAIEIPHTCGLNAEKAKHRILNNSPFSDIKDEALFNIYREFLAIPDPNEATNLAELSKIQPVISQIKQQAQSNWPNECKL